MVKKKKNKNRCCRAAYMYILELVLTQNDKKKYEIYDINREITRFAF